MEEFKTSLKRFKDCQRKANMKAKMSTVEIENLREKNRLSKAQQEQKLRKNFLQSLEMMLRNGKLNKNKN